MLENVYQTCDSGGASPSMLLDYTRITSLFLTLRNTSTVAVSVGIP